MKNKLDIKSKVYYKNFFSCLIIFWSIFVGLNYGVSEGIVTIHDKYIYSILFNIVSSIIISNISAKKFLDDEYIDEARNNIESGNLSSNEINKILSERFHLRDKTIKVIVSKLNTNFNK